MDARLKNNGNQKKSLLARQKKQIHVTAKALRAVPGDYDAMLDAV